MERQLHISFSKCCIAFFQHFFATTNYKSIRIHRESALVCHYLSFNPSALSGFMKTVLEKISPFPRSKVGNMKIQRKINHFLSTPFSSFSFVAIQLKVNLDLLPSGTVFGLWKENMVFIIFFLFKHFLSITNYLLTKQKAYSTYLQCAVLTLHI